MIEVEKDRYICVLGIKEIKVEGEENDYNGALVTYHLRLTYYEGYSITIRIPCNEEWVKKTEWEDVLKSRKSKAIELQKKIIKEVNRYIVKNKLSYNADLLR